MPKTVKQMWEAFEFRAARTALNPRLRTKLRASYYAGCHGMLEALLITMNEGQLTKEQITDEWQKWMDELGKFSDDYKAGKL